MTVTNVLEEEVKQMCLYLLMFTILHCFTTVLALQFLICTCSQVHVVNALRSLMSGGSNV
jgi:hypothetical protein